MTESPREKQQREEQFALDRFRGACGLLPGKDSRGGDPPDFIIRRAGHRTSVETTAFHTGSVKRGGSKQAAEDSNARQLADRAQSIFEATYPDVHVEVRPYFILERIDRRELDHLARLVAQLVADCLPPLPEPGVPQTRVDLTWNDLPESVATLISHLSLARWRRGRWRPQSSSVWLLGSVGYAAVDTSELESIIRRKEKDLARYRAAFDASWLLIYGLWQRSSFFDFDYLKPGMFTSQFDGVVYVDAMTGRYVQIA